MDNIETRNEEKRENRMLMIGLAVLVCAVIALSVIGFCCLSEPDDLIEGQADATTVRISGKLPGRVVEIMAHEGDMVHAGDTLIHIHSSLIEAKLAQAEGMENVSKAMDKKVDAGTRIQIIQGAEQLVNQARAARIIAEKTYTRMENLCSQGVVSEQKRDEAKAAYDAALAGEKAAESQLSLAKAGAQSEDKTASAAMVSVAQGSVREVEALLEDQYLTAPCDGQIEQVYPEIGELVSLGAPLMSLLKTDDKWVTFSVREEELENIKLGQEIELTVPALGQKKIKAKVYYIRALGSYATWRATKATGEWDSRTFEVKARPVEKQPDMLPGMTVLYNR